MLALLMAGALSAAPQQAPEKAPPKQLEKQRQKPAAGAKEEIPPEEDTSQGVVEYSFNPLQSTKDVNVGNQYLKNHKYRAAEMRYTSATKWNDGNAEAWLRLGDAEEKLKDPQSAREAYGKYLEISPDAKNAPEIKKKVEKMK